MGECAHEYPLWDTVAVKIKQRTGQDSGSGLRTVFISIITDLQETHFSHWLINLHCLQDFVSSPNKAMRPQRQNMVLLFFFGIYLTEAA